jgi:hypothetical protein
MDKEDFRVMLESRYRQGYCNATLELEDGSVLHPILRLHLCSLGNNHAPDIPHACVCRKTWP